MQTSDKRVPHDTEKEIIVHLTFVRQNSNMLHSCTKSCSPLYYLPMLSRIYGITALRLSISFPSLESRRHIARRSSEVLDQVLVTSRGLQVTAALWATATAPGHTGELFLNECYRSLSSSFMARTIIRNEGTNYKNYRMERKRA